MAHPPTTVVVSGPLGAVVMACYLALLLGLGVLGRWATRRTGLSEFFLAGRGLGTVVLLLTLFATQYSGNTLLGVAGASYRNGYAFVVAVPFMLAIIAVAMVIAPGFHRLGQRHGYITLADAVHGRFRSRTLSSLVALVGVWALANFLVTNLIAAGLLVERVTGGGVGPVPAIIGLALVMVVYETLGGLRAVAWTDVVQGVLIVTGMLAITAAVLMTYGGPGEVYARIASESPRLLRPPSLEGKISWVSTLLLVGIGAAIYPHAVQRYYAARTSDALRRSLSFMLVVPFLIVPFSVWVGLVGRGEFPDLSREESDRVALFLLADLVERSPALLPLVIVFVTAVLAAIMSSVDSVLLSLSATITQDLYRPLRGPGATEAHLTWVGKAASWGVMAVSVLAAVTLRESIWRLVQIKLEVLLQAAPAAWLALYGRGYRATPVLVGLLAGTSIALLPVASELSAALTGGPLVVPEKWRGVHLGVLGLLVNAGLVFGLSRFPGWGSGRPDPVP